MCPVSGVLRLCAGGAGSPRSLKVNETTPIVPLFLTIFSSFFLFFSPFPPSLFQYYGASGAYRSQRTLTDMALIGYPCFSCTIRALVAGEKRARLKKTPRMNKIIQVVRVSTIVTSRGPHTAFCSPLLCAGQERSQTKNLRS